MKKILLLITTLTVILNAGNFDTGLSLFEKQQFKKSLGYFLKAEKEGDYDSLYPIANIHYFGLEMPVNYKKALEYFLKAEKKGDPRAYEFLGYMYANAEGTKEDIEKALYYYKKGADKNDAASICNLSEYYINGWGTQKNYFKAIKLVKKGHELGGENCKKIWDAYGLAEKKERHQLNYSDEKRLCKKYAETNLEKAIEHCEYSVQLKPNDVSSRVRLLISYSKMGYSEDALREANYLDKVYLDDNSKLLIYTQKANILLEQQKNDEAENYYNKALSVINSASRKKLRNMYYANIYNGLGLVYKNKKNYQKSLKYFGKSLSYSKSSTINISIYNNIGLVYMHQGRYQDSIKKFNESIKISKQLGDYLQKDLILSNLGLAHFLSDDLNKAKKYVSDAIIGAEKTNNLTALYNSYFVYSAIIEQEGNKNESDIYFNKAQNVAANMGINLEGDTNSENFSPTMLLKNLYKKDSPEKKTRRR